MGCGIDGAITTHKQGYPHWMQWESHLINGDTFWLNSGILVYYGIVICLGNTWKYNLCFPPWEFFLDFCFPDRLLFCFSLLLRFSASLRFLSFCFSVCCFSLLLCFFVFSFFPCFFASLLFCFFASLLFAFSASLLVYFSAFLLLLFCFLLFLLLCFTCFFSFLLLCFCASVPFYFYCSTFSFL